MMQPRTSLFLCLLLSACGRPEDAEPSNEAAATTPLQTSPLEAQANASAPAKAGTSVMRPSVVAEAEVEAPPPPPEPAKAAILFETGSKLSDEGRAQLDELLATPAAAGGGPIVIRGHTDSKGDDSRNLRASRNRAEAVRDYLVERGIDPSRITVIALGETRPVAPNANPDGSDFEEGRRRNRRVEVDIAVQPAPPLPQPSQAAEPAEPAEPAE